MTNKNRNTEEYIKDVIAEIESGDFSNADNPVKKFYIYLYKLGDGSIAKGSARDIELEEKRHEQERKDNPAFALVEDMGKSDNPVHRMFVEFLLQHGMTLPLAQAQELQEKLLKDEIYKSAKQLPTLNAAQAAEPPKPEKPTRKKILDQACIEWASRDSHGYLGRYTRDEFLDDFQEKTGEMISKDEFRRALEDAQKRGIIAKVKGRLKPKTSP
ncbi:MAG: hypothetical protein Fur002_08380 [Anaerolineales bacterium]